MRADNIDIVCHGSPSPKLWKEYVQSLEMRKGKIEYLTFKDKRYGWKSPTAFITIEGQEYSIKDYVKVFYNRCALRPSCHVCPYATTERKTDITIENFWHIEEKIPDFYDSQGNSLFLIHTNRGAELFEQLKEAIDCRESNTTECWQFNLKQPTPVSEKRDIFWKDCEKHGVDYIMKKYETVSVMTKVKNKVKKIIRARYLLSSISLNYADFSERRMV